MKLRYIIATIAAALTLAVGCEKEMDHYLDEIKVTSSYLSFPAGGGSVEINYIAIDSWTVSGLPDFISASPASGGQGEGVIKFTATAATETREGTFTIDCAGKSQTISYIQVTEKVEPKLTSMADVIAAGAGTFRIKGTVVKIVNTTYGNWYINDGTTDANSGNGIYIYGTLNKKGNTYDKNNPAMENINCPANPDAWEFAPGDIVTVEGPYTLYNGNTPEMVDVTVIEIERSLIGVSSIFLLGDPEGEGKNEYPLEGGNISVTLDIKGEGFHVNIPEEAKSWLHIADFGPDYVVLSADANPGGDRKATVVFSTTKDGTTYTCEQEFVQKGAILEVPVADFLAAAVGDTQFRLTGVITSNYESDKNGQSFNMRDWSAETLVYRLNDYKASGAQVGDIITVVGKRGAYKESPQMVEGVYEKHIATVKDKKLSEIAAAADDPNVYYIATGTVKEIANETYGNLWLTDDSGDLYVYGCYPGWGASGDNRKNFLAAAGIKVGDKLSVIGVKSTHNEAPQISNGIYFSHEEGAAPAVEFDYTPSDAYKAAGNLWKAVEDAKAQRYFYSVNPDWAGQIYSGFGTDLPPYAEFIQSTYKLNFETATTGRWQNQFFVHPDDAHNIPLEASKTYKVSITAQSTNKFDAFFKLVAADAAKDNREGATIWEPAGDGIPSNVFFEANKPVVLEGEISGVDAPSINIFFDLGGNPANTIVYIKDITVVEVGGGSGEVPALFLNEFDTQNKKLEIYNSTDAEVDIAGWQLVKDGGLEEKDIFTIPASLDASKVPAKGYVVFTCKQTDAANGPLFGLSGTKGFKIELKKGDTVVDVADNLTSITEIPDGKSWGRKADGDPEFVVFDTPTIGASNGAAPVDNTLSITDILKQEKDTAVESKECQVVALTQRGFVASDGDKAVYVYTQGGDFNGKVGLGDKIKFAGSKTVYNGVHEIEKVSALEILSVNNTINYPAAKDVTASATSYEASEAEFVSFTGTLAISGNYYNVTLDGIDSGTKQGSLVYPADYLGAKSFDGKHIRVEGYFNGLSGGGKYLNVIATSIDEVGAAAPVSITIDGDMSDWAEVTTGVTSDAETPVYHTFKVAADDEYIYFYSKRDNRAAIWNSGGYFYYDIDADNDSTTGVEKDGIPGLEFWMYVKPFAGSADAPAIATAFKGEAYPSTDPVKENFVFAGVNGESYVELESRLPLSVAGVKKGDTIKVYSWSNKDGYDVQKKPVEITL